MSEHVYCVFHTIKWEGSTLCLIFWKKENADKECAKLNEEIEDDEYMYYSVEQRAIL